MDTQEAARNWMRTIEMIQSCMYILFGVLTLGHCKLHISSIASREGCIKVTILVCGLVPSQFKQIENVKYGCFHCAFHNDNKNNNDEDSDNTCNSNDTNYQYFYGLYNNFSQSILWYIPWYSEFHFFVNFNCTPNEWNLAPFYAPCSFQINTILAVYTPSTKLVWQ